MEMKRKLSKEQLTDLAQQAVSSLRRLMSSSHDSMTLTQQDLMSTTKTIEERWQKKRMGVDESVVDLWTTSFREELVLQIEYASPEMRTSENGRSSSASSTNKKTTTTPPLPPKVMNDSLMLMCLEALRILLRTTSVKLAENLLCCHIARHMTNYFMKVPMSKKVRDVFAPCLLEVMGLDEQLFEESITVSEGLLAPCKQMSKKTAVSPRQVHLAWVIAAACRRADVNNLSLNAVRTLCGRSGFLSKLIGTSAMLTGTSTSSNDSCSSSSIHTTEATAVTAVSSSCSAAAAAASTAPVTTCTGEGMQLTACLAYFGLVSSIVRGCEVNKQLCREKHLEELATLWVAAASSVSRVDLTMLIPTNIPGKDAPLAVESAQVWAAELTEFLIELSTSDSFALRRQSLYEDSMDNSSDALGVPIPGSTPTSPSPLSSPSVLRAARRYEYLPAHWDTLLTGGSAYAWRLASLLCNCILSADSCGFIASVLLRLDTQTPLSESIYRNVVATLMLLCVATPRNAELLANSPIIEALIALITHMQESAFPREVLIDGKLCTPNNTVNANVVQMTMGFLGILTSLCFPEEKLQMLQRAVESMNARQSSLSDVEIVEFFLHVQSCVTLPPGVLFLSGTGSVVCKVDSFDVSRFHGYSFAAWINPKCVWLEGSHLFSYADTASGSTVMLMVVANGRSCSLALRIQHSTELTLSVIPDTAMAADAWSHVAFTHSLSGFVVFINGRRTEGNLSLPFPKEPSKKNRLQLAFGGSQNEPSFFGFIASIDLFDGTLSEKDIQRMQQAGPRPSRELSLSCRTLLSVEGQVYAGASFLSAAVTGTLVRKHEGVSVHNVIAINQPSTLEKFHQHDIVNWALSTVKKAKGSPSFPVVARLCVQFISTAMKMASTPEELSRVTGTSALSRLSNEVLSWDAVPIEVPAILLACTIPRGGGKAMRAHASTQVILSLLLDIVQDGNASPTAISCVLRELSDSLLVPENLVRFREGSRRFERILNMSVNLPLKCVENIILLVERLCKEQQEMEQTLVFLLSASLSKTADHVKAEILHMLFEIARTNTSMCDLIGGAFGNCGVSFLIKLVGGMNHSSEAIRVYALRIISLMQHTSRKFRDYFVKSRGHEILAMVMTDPLSTVPIRLPTFNCLFQMAFDALQPATPDPTIAQLGATTPTKSKRRSLKPQHQDPNRSGMGPKLGLQGFLPGLFSQKLRVARREYSFDMTHDFALSSDARFLRDDAHRLKGCVALQVPQAIQTVLRVLERHLQGGPPVMLPNNNYNSGCMPRGLTTPDMASLLIDGAEERNVSSTATTCPAMTPTVTAATMAAAGFTGNERSIGGDNGSTISAGSPINDENTEAVALRVLHHLEKIVDRPENGEVLLSFPWLAWLWEAVGQLLDSPSSSNNAQRIPSPSPTAGSSFCSPSPSACLISAGIGAPPRFSKKQVTAIQQRVRNIVRSLAILDLSRNAKAATVRIVRSGEHPPVLTRLVLEAIVSHLTKRSAISTQAEAVNIIKNLDTLFAGVEDVVHLSVGLGVEIVNSISSIAVNNNSWVRMRMKNSSRLFETRSHLALVLLSSIKRFSKQDPAALGQLLDANAPEANAVRVIVHRLLQAAYQCDVDELEVLLSAMRQLTVGEVNNRQVVYSIIGPEYSSFADLITTFTGVTATASVTSELTPVSSGSSWRPDEKLVEQQLPTSAVIQWCREDKNHCKALRQRVMSSTRSMDVAPAGDHEESERERSSRQRRLNERGQSSYVKALAEVERMTREVEMHLGRCPTPGGSGSGSGRALEATATFAAK